MPHNKPRPTRTPAPPASVSQSPKPRPVPESPTQTNIRSLQNKANKSIAIVRAELLPSQRSKVPSEAKIVKRRPGSNTIAFVGGRTPNIKVAVDRSGRGQAGVGVIRHEVAHLLGAGHIAIGAATGDISGTGRSALPKSSLQVQSAIKLQQEDAGRRFTRARRNIFRGQRMNSQKRVSQISSKAKVKRELLPRQTQAPAGTPQIAKTKTVGFAVQGSPFAKAQRTGPMERRQRARTLARRLGTRLKNKGIDF